MPQLTYANTTFCTPADVRARLGSPEEVIILTKDDNTRYGVTANTTTDLFTTGIASNYSAGQEISFETTGTLPAPLVSGTGYYVIATGLTPTAFSISTIKGGAALDITTAGTGTLSVYSSALDLAIAEKIVFAQDIVRQELINYFQEKIPGNVRGMMAFKRSQLDAAQSDFSRSLELAARGTGSWYYDGFYGYITPDGIFYGADTQFTGQIPALRVNYGIPVSGASGTFAGTSINGDFLADVRYGNLYLNRQTVANTPVWDLFQPGDGINYLLNPSELKHAMVARTLQAMAEDGTWRNRLNPSNVDLKNFMTYTLEHWKEQYKIDLKRGLSCVDVDISGSGLMNDWKRGISRSEVVICG